jgi:hypothetical protein
MPELYVEPRVLADAGRSFDTERSVLADVAGALAPTLTGVAAALPGSHTAELARGTGAALAAAVRSATAELAELAHALTGAAHDYTAVDDTAAAGIERAGRRPA